MAKKISESVSEFAKKFGLEDLTKFEDDAGILDKVLSLLDEKVNALVSEKLNEEVKEKVKEYEEIILGLEEQLNEYSNSEATSEATSERTFLEWQKYDPKGLKSMKLNDPERYAKIPGRH